MYGFLLQGLAFLFEYNLSLFLYISYPYCKTCAWEVTCETMAVMGGTLANAGVCPITSEETLKPESVRYVKNFRCP